MAFYADGDKAYRAGMRFGVVRQTDKWERFWADEDLEYFKSQPEAVKAAKNYFKQFDVGHGFAVFRLEKKGGRGDEVWPRKYGPVHRPLGKDKDEREERYQKEDREDIMRELNQ